MRIRLRTLLPLLLGLLVAAGFLGVAATVGDAIRGSLTTVPGVTRERAVEAAIRAVTLWGLLVTGIAVASAFLIARMIVRPLEEMSRAAQYLNEGTQPPETETPVAEVQDVARGVSRAAHELRDRHARSARQQSELAALVEAVSEGIIQVDAAGRIERANHASRHLLGLPAGILGRPIAAMIRNEPLRAVVERGATGEPTAGAEVALDDRRLLVSVSPQPGGGTVVTLVDLTDLRRLEEVRRDFVANASHELKTPLTSLRGYSETLLQSDLPEPERRQFLATIARNAERLQRIVDDLLDLSRLESGRWEPELEPIHVLQLAESCWAAVAERDPSRSIRFSVEGDPEGRALADRRGLEQVLANLFDNALRHTPDGGSVRVTAHAVPKDSGPPITAHTVGGKPGVALPAAHSAWTLVEVTDTGTGIPRDALPRIFERFYRVDPARSRAEGGTGLGLSIVKHMVESMGGAVAAESVLGKLTTIRFWLPRAPD